MELQEVSFEFTPMQYKRLLRNFPAKANPYGSDKRLVIVSEEQYEQMAYACAEYSLMLEELGLNMHGLAKER